MLKSIVFLVLLLSAPFSVADESATAVQNSQDTQYIYMGLIEVGGMASLTYLNDEMQFIFNPYGGYFLTDRIFVGGSVLYASSRGIKDTIGLGPLAKYYFYNTGKCATYVGQQVSASWTDGNDVITGTTTLGSQYFLNSKVAFGVSLNYTYSLEDYVSDASPLNLLFSFSTFF